MANGSNAAPDAFNKDRRFTGPSKSFQHPGRRNAAPRLPRNTLGGMAHVNIHAGDYASMKTLPAHRFAL